jgi:hypothetical protein
VAKPQPGASLNILLENPARMNMLQTDMFVMVAV